MIRNKTGYPLIEFGLEDLTEYMDDDVINKLDDRDISEITSFLRDKLMHHYFDHLADVVQELHPRPKGAS